MSELVLFSPPADEPLTIVDIVNGLGLAVDDPKIPDLIRTARQSLEGEEGWLGRALITQTWDLYLDAFPCEIVLPFPPLQAVTEIAVADSDGVEAILPRTSYRVLKGAIGRIVATRSWPWVGAREQGVRVRFVCGYGDGGEDVPAPIRSALVLMVGRRGRWFDDMDEPERRARRDHGNGRRVADAVSDLVMTPRARQMLQAYHEDMPSSTVTLRRSGEADCQARARISGVRTDELIGGLDQTVRTAIVLASQVTFGTPLRRGDKLITPAGEHLTIEICDADTRSVDGILIAYELTVMG
jgi:uncharacterized phiE125 gp8 family phage protein